MLYHNGKWKTETDPIFTSHDRIRLGDGVFDTMLAIDGRLIHPDKHLQRLRDNAAILGISFDLEFESTAQQLLQKSEQTKGRTAINTIISRGPGRRGLASPENPEIQIVMRAARAPAESPPIHAVIAESVRRNEGSPLSQIKSFNYGDNVIALNEARQKGANEAILLNNAGHVTCATSANIIACIDGALYTPPLSDGVLNGTTRQVLMEHYPITEKSLSAEDLINASHLLITNCIRGAQAIEKLGEKPFPAELPLEIHKDFYLY